MQQEIEKRLLWLKGLTIEEYYEAFGDAEQWLQDLEQSILPKQEDGDETAALCEKLTQELSVYPVWMKIHLLSFCMKCSGEVTYAEWLMQEILDADYYIHPIYHNLHPEFPLHLPLAGPIPDRGM